MRSFHATHDLRFGWRRGSQSQQRHQDHPGDAEPCSSLLGWPGACACGRWPDRPEDDWRHPQFPANPRSEEHTSELQSLMRISYAVFCLKKKKLESQNTPTHTI